MRLVSKDLIQKRRRVVDSKVSQEMPILMTGNLVLEEALESQMRRKVDLDVVTGAASQTKLTREVMLRRELRALLHLRPMTLRQLLRSQRLLRLRRRRKKSLRKKKLSSVSASMISSRQELLKTRQRQEKLKVSRVLSMPLVTTKRKRSRLPF